MKYFWRAIALFLVLLILLDRGADRVLVGLTRAFDSLGEAIDWWVERLGL